jgi:methylenetetrahydrofolate reductase (NADPH)
MTTPARERQTTVARIAAFTQGFSIETTRPSDADIVALQYVPRGTPVFVSAVPGRPANEAVDVARRLRVAGMEPVPHIAARNFETRAALDDFLARLCGEASVQRVLLIAGDREASGPFTQALDVIGSGLLRRHGIRRIGVAGYPDGHPRIRPEALERALRDKIAAAEADRLELEIVTQFCFEAEPILDYVARLRESGVTAPVRVGLVGPTSPTALVRFALRCGVRASARGLTRNSGLLRGVLGMAYPDGVLRRLGEAAITDTHAHFYSFGGLPNCARFAQAVAEGRVALNGEGFTVTAAPADETAGAPARD